MPIFRIQGPTLFSTNGTNAERSIAVLKNLTTEFSQTIYGGVVIGQLGFSLLPDLGLRGVDVLLQALSSLMSHARSRKTSPWPSSRPSTRAQPPLSETQLQLG